MDATDLAFAGAAQQARLVRDGEVSARELVEACLERIERLDPRLNTFRVVFAERALTEADQAQARLQAGERRPLLGVPVAIKDDVDVAGEVTAWGTSATGPAAERDAEVVRRLRAAGALVIGKTNLPEMAQWPFSESKTFGPTRNPWDPERTPGGSSGGTAAAVASGMVGLGLGSDGAGSIRIPSGWCGVFGLKPSRDNVPLAPHDGAWQGMSVNGPIARHVADAALFMDATADRAPQGGYLAVVEAAAQEPRPLRIAMSTKLAPGQMARVSAEARGAMHGMAEILRSLGHEVVERDPDYPRNLFANVLVRYLRGIHDDVAALVVHPERLERRTRTIASWGGLIPERTVRKVREAEAGIAARVGRLFEQCDVLLTPGAAAGPFRIGQFADRGAFWTLNVVAARVPYFGLYNALGQPAMSIPAGLDGEGLPLSVHVVGRPDGETTLLALAAQLESARPWADRRPPIS